MEQSRTVENVVEAVVKHRRIIEAYANTVVRDFHLAEDIYQEVALVVAKKWRQIPGGAELLPWLKETTRRKSLEALRKRRKKPLTFSDEVLELLAVDEFDAKRFQTAQAERREQQYHRLESCLRKLPNVAQQVFRMRYGEEHMRSCDEISGVVGRSVKAVYDIIARARVALLKCVQEATGQESGGVRA